jgi:hypothetical protein
VSGRTATLLRQLVRWRTAHGLYSGTLDTPNQHLAGLKKSWNRLEWRQRARVRRAYKAEVQNLKSNYDPHKQDSPLDYEKASGSVTSAD